jgi:hypothetical protein
MNWKLVFSLSLFGLVMGIATVFVIPSNIEPAFWLVIFLACAYLIARGTSTKRFQHGIYLGMANSIWITSCHILLFDQYLAHHPQEAAMLQSMPIAESGKLLMAVVGSAIGFVSGAVIGILAVIAAKVLKPATANS